MPTRRYMVRGRVQGVCFRASTRDQATELKLDGNAVNRADGSVEVIATGNDAALDALGRWLQRGPPLAHVESVNSTVVESEMYPAPGFRIG